MKNLKASKFQFLCKPNQHGSKLTQIRKRKRNNYQYQQMKSGVLERCNQRRFSWKAAIKDVGGGNLNGYYKVVLTSSCSRWRSQEDTIPKTILIVVIFTTLENISFSSTLIFC
uniref:Uncharacterized protein n=1 Tax=Lactuca sativa TaxID=4236 RepID=A0A9R1WSD5_LACSA|nr:hypothetical protein LSAT_V11C100027620 [Lactuca sativa]